MYVYSLLVVYLQAPYTESHATCINRTIYIVVVLVIVTSLLFVSLFVYEMKTCTEPFLKKTFLTKTSLSLTPNCLPWMHSTPNHPFIVHEVLVTGRSPI